MSSMATFSLEGFASREAQLYEGLVGSLDVFRRDALQKLFEQTEGRRLIVLQKQQTKQHQQQQQQQQQLPSK